jgi:hypothetical protein
MPEITEEQRLATPLEVDGVSNPHAEEREERRRDWIRVAFVAGVIVLV